MTREPRLPDNRDDITFTRDELLAEIDLLAQQLNAGEIERSGAVHTAASLQMALLALNETVDSDLEPSEEQRIADEEYRVGVAKMAVSSLSSIFGSYREIANEWKPFLATPAKDARIEREEAERQRAHTERIEALKADIDALESGYSVSSKSLRRTKYRVAGEARNGIWLKQQVEAVVSNGSDMAVFVDAESRKLTGLALATSSPDTDQAFIADIDKLGQLHSQLRRYKTHYLSPGIFSAYKKLTELLQAEDDKILQAKDLAPLVAWARRIEKLSTTLDDASAGLELDEQLDFGPFQTCKQLDIAPFALNMFGEDAVRGTTREIPDEKFTEGNITDDIENAVSRSRGGHVIEDQRISDFINLKNKLEEKYGLASMRLFRTLHPKWHPMPWYGIEVRDQAGNKMAVLETPVTGNASYFLNDNDWMNVIMYKRFEAQQLGAEYVIHVPGQDGSIVRQVPKLLTKFDEATRRNSQ